MRVNIDRVAVVERPLATSNFSTSAPLPGTVLEVSPGLVIATADGAIEVQELQPAGKRSMPAADFLRGNRVKLGNRFGPL
jgi:methionyl-tRNA formyltransferase